MNAPMTLEQAFDIIELEDKSILAKMKNPSLSFEEATKVVEELHTTVNKQRKKMAKKYHPDKGGDEEKFKIINDTCDKLLKIKVERRPMIQPMTIIIRSSVYYESSTTTSSTTGYWAF